VARDRRSSLADQSVWDALPDDTQTALRRLTRDGLGPAERLVACHECGSSNVTLLTRCLTCRADHA
jgi:hypothetical protein